MHGYTRIAEHPNRSERQSSLAWVLCRKAGRRVKDVVGKRNGEGGEKNGKQKTL
jgi:hypothetical protein